MARPMLLYRGSLKSCNYSCSYCPFAKRRLSSCEQIKDRENWERFVSRFESLDGQFGAVMVVPYGEALIHPWYWEGLARISRLEWLEAAGAQTNLSFDTADRLAAYREAGGRMEKLRLWATFHPEMTTVTQFTEQCCKLLSEGVRFCTGAVGAPENLETIRRLRRALPPEVYLWINRMDGLNRRYTKEEEEAFTGIDPWFSRELYIKKADPDQCRGRLFVEADGRMRRCNIAVPSAGNWFEGERTVPLSCGRNACTCYLAYGGRADCNGRTAFGRWPLFRIPWSPQALFLDLDGTVLSENNAAPAISAEWMDFIRREARTKHLFLATSRPQRDAAAKCHGILPWISGGIYGAGAHVVIHGTDVCGPNGNRSKDGMEMSGFKESFHTFDAPWLSRLSELQSRLGFRLRVCRHGDLVYKVTLSRPKSRVWEAEEEAVITSILSSDSIRCFIEKSQLQIVSREADKGKGVREICALMGISPLDTAAIGNSEEDAAMFRTCGYGIAVHGCSDLVADAADLVAECCPGDITFHIAQISD